MRLQTLKDDLFMSCYPRSCRQRAEHEYLSGSKRGSNATLELLRAWKHITYVKMKGLLLKGDETTELSPNFNRNEGSRHNYYAHSETV
jgi:hypothetical protein